MASLDLLLRKSVLGTITEVYLQSSTYVSFNCTANAVGGKVGRVNQVNHISWATVVIPTDCLQSLRSNCLPNFGTTV